MTLTRVRPDGGQPESAAATSSAEDTVIVHTSAAGTGAVGMLVCMMGSVIDSGGGDTMEDRQGVVGYGKRAGEEKLAGREAYIVPRPHHLFLASRI